MNNWVGNYSSEENEVFSNGRGGSSPLPGTNNFRL